MDSTAASDSTGQEETVNRWIAYEHDDDGWRTDAYLLAVANTAEDAKRLMGEAIAARAAHASRHMRARIWAIFIEAPAEVASDDPRAIEAPGLDPVFHGFDEA